MDAKACSQVWSEVGKAMIEFPIFKDAPSKQSHHLARVTVENPLANGKRSSSDVYVYHPSEHPYSVLRCECVAASTKGWCQHLRAVYIEHLDAQKHCDVPRRIGWAPLITVFNNPTLLVQTILEPVEERMDVLGVHLAFGRLQKNVHDEYTSEGGEHIGFINPNVEGVGAIRTLVLDWLPSKFFDVGITCQAKSHSGVTSYNALAENLLARQAVDPATVTKRNDQEWRELVRDIHTILDTGKCAKCFQAENIPF